jgi:hypothetical protein
MRTSLLAGLLFASVVHADLQLQVVEARPPDRPIWGTNIATFAIHNSGASPRDVTLDWYAKSAATNRGFGYDDKFTIPAGATQTLRETFIVPAFPGEVTLRLRVRDVAANVTIWEQNTMHEFPFANSVAGQLELPERIAELIKVSKRVYPALRMAQRGRLVVYYLDGDEYVQGHLDAIADERARIYKELAAKINRAFDQEIALYLFPDAESKLAYTGHRGDGWAVGRILVEIFNAKKRIDPYHEMTHIVAGSIGNPPAMLNEGLAAWMQDGHRWDGVGVDSWVKAFAARGALWPMEKLFSFTEIGSDATRAPIAYPQAASISGYLIERLGWEKFLAAYRVLQNQSDSAAFEKAFGVGLAEFEKDWLKQIQAPEIVLAPEAKVSEVLAKYREQPTKPR